MKHLRPIFTLMAFPFSLTAADLSIADFGIKANSNTNTTPAVRKALEKLKTDGGGTLVFPKGTYHFHVDGTKIVKDGLYVSNNQDDFPKWIAMPIEGMKNVTIDGKGSTFLFHHRMMVFSIEQSENIKLKNLTIDFVRPIHSDSTITGIDENTFTLKFEPETTYKINDKGEFRFLVDGQLMPDWSSYSFEGSTCRSKFNLAQGFGHKLSRCKAKEIKPGLVLFEGKLKPAYKINDRITHRHNNRNHVGIFIHQSKDTQINQVTMHHACGMGILGQRSENISIHQFAMIPSHQGGRISTAMADATHFSGCRGLIKVTNSHFKGMMDDAINVHGTTLQITEIDSKTNTVTAKFMEGQSKGFPIASPGDEIRLIDNMTLLPVGDGFYKVAAVKRTDELLVQITFDQKLPASLKLKNTVENITYTPEVIFSQNIVENNRARGMLFNTPRKCLVEKNKVTTAGSAVLIAGDANGWFESGAVGEFGPTIIRNNIFNECLTSMFQFCHAIVSVDPIIKQVNPQQSYHRDIQIEGNHFKVFDAPLVFARSVDGLKITGNTFERSKTFQPWHPNKKAFKFEGCQNVTLKDNKVLGDLISKEIELKQMDKQQLDLGKQSIFVH